MGMIANQMAIDMLTRLKQKMKIRKEAKKQVGSAETKPLQEKQKGAD